MQGRLISLDVFRGLTVALMILVNNPGSWAHIYPPLRHARWHGWTPTDLVFPFFLFIVGVAISLSFSRRLEAGADRQQLLGKIIYRTVLIFVLGLFLNGFPFTGGSEQWVTLRIWGVLQRIAVCYLLAGLTVVLLPTLKGRVGLTVALLLLFELGMRLPLAAGWGAGSFALEDNFVRWLDLATIGAQHMYGGTGIPFDPEGLWSTLPAAATALLGFFCGEFLRREGALTRKLKTLILWGMAGVVTGQILHFIEPVNKQLWTVSYVILTAGLALLTLAVSIWAMDIRRWTRWTKPAVVFGSNALVVFVGSGIMARLLVLIKVPGGGSGEISLKYWLYSNLFVSWAGPLNGSLFFALTFILVWLGVLWILYARRIFLKI